MKDTVYKSFDGINDQSFKTDKKPANRLLQDRNFKIDDELFRKYVNLLFDMITEHNTSTAIIIIHQFPNYHHI